MKDYIVSVKRPIWKKGFTLAEVLITLGIIGVVAALTLPTLIANYQKNLALTQLKKNYAILTQAVSLMRAHYDNIDPVQMPFTRQQWDHPTYLDTTLFGPELAKYLPVVWHRMDSDGKFCFPDTASWNIKQAKSSTPTAAGAAWHHTNNDYVWKLNNGACIGFAYGRNWDWDGTNTNARTFVIDVNGEGKGPNTLGKDIYLFEFMPDGRIVPAGFNLTDDEARNHWCRCNNTGEYCALLIYKNGWNFPKDYPLNW